MHTTPKVIPRGTDTLTDRQTHIYLRFRDKLSLVARIGYIKGLGAMLAEERMAASEKGYENGLGAMSA